MVESPVVGSLFHDSVMASTLRDLSLISQAASAETARAAADRRRNFISVYSVALGTLTLSKNLGSRGKEMAEGVGFGGERGGYR
jgi:hypothetical protein